LKHGFQKSKDAWSPTGAPPEKLRRRRRRFRFDHFREGLVSRRNHGFGVRHPRKTPCTPRGVPLGPPALRPSGDGLTALHSLTLNTPWVGGFGSGNRKCKNLSTIFGDGLVPPIDTDKNATARKEIKQHT